MSDERRQDDEAFRRAMQDVRPLGDARRRTVRRRTKGSAARSGETPRFEIETEGSRRYGRRDDAPTALLDHLRAGRLEPANRLDLHGMSEESARERVFRFVRQSRASGLRCIALIHGRGLRSPGGPVLKESVPAWLTQLPLARQVAAFGSAPRQQGGDGVTLVVLERRG